MQADSIVSEILDLYIQYGGDEYIGEAVNQLEHMSQTAELAIQEGHDDEVVLAAFFHDIGHLCVSKNTDNDLGGLGIKNHEQVGASYLKKLGFPERIIQLVDSHVEAKRYLCYKSQDYYGKLSDASKATLTLQGGVMTQAEAQQFEKNPLSELMVKMREWDDRAKKVGVPVMDLCEIVNRINKVLKQAAIVR